MTDLARTQRGAGEPATAENTEQAALKKLKKTVGRPHSLTLRSREGLARCLWAQKEARGKAREARAQARKALEGSAALFGWAHPSTWVRAELVAEIEAGKGEKELRERVMGERERWGEREGGEREWEKGDDEGAIMGNLG